jgi:hypothetical protein
MNFSFSFCFNGYVFRSPFELPMEILVGCFIMSIPTQHELCVSKQLRM